MNNPTVLVTVTGSESSEATNSGREYTCADLALRAEPRLHQPLRQAQSPLHGSYLPVYDTKTVTSVL
ncbi:hypothetical protein ABT173_01515 [Streptomyces sp. NPDC001795]|uniref:hypothetical protein n=1 Tax=Streptomyces sp. NPDC001795 TaxID=3154525 RepID=UPI003330B808